MSAIHEKVERFNTKLDHLYIVENAISYFIIMLSSIDKLYYYTLQVSLSSSFIGDKYHPDDHSV